MSREEKELKNKKESGIETFKKNLPPQFVKRCIVLCLGLLIMALGVAFSIQAGLGTSPISSLPYVLSIITPLTVGKTTICMHCVLILLQIIILRKKYQPFQLLQLPVAIIFGYLTDLCVWIVERISYAYYWQQWILCVIGTALVALGVSLEVLSRVVTLAGEGLVLAVCRVLPLKFGNMKIAFDVTLVVIACVLSLIFLHNISGVREGTVFAALLVGTFSKQMLKPMVKFEEKHLM